MTGLVRVGFPLYRIMTDLPRSNTAAGRATTQRDVNITHTHMYCVGYALNKYYTDAGDGVNEEGASEEGANEEGANEEGANEEGANEEGANKEGANEEGASE